jgi:hypothetical protein
MFRRQSRQETFYVGGLLLVSECCVKNAQPQLQPTVLRTGSQRGVNLKVALVERRRKPKRTVAKQLVRWLIIPSIII